MELSLKINLTASGLVQVGDPPTGFALSNDEVEENSPFGTVIGTLSATDPDGGTVTFGLSDETLPFLVQGTNLIVAGQLDFETKVTYNFSIDAVGSRGGSAANPVTITVTDQSETPPPNPPPDEPPVEDGGFTVPTQVTEADGVVVIHGKKAPGSIGKLVVPIGRNLVADDIITVQFDFDASLMSLQGRKVAVGFVLKQGNDFHFIGMQGNGSTGSNVKSIYGDNKWNSQTGLTEINDGAPINGSQLSGWIQLAVDSSGENITFRTATDPAEQADFDDEVVDRIPNPFSEATDPSQVGIGIIWQADDTGPYAFTARFYDEGEPEIPSDGDPFFASVVFLSGFEGVDGSTSNFSDDAGGHTIGGLGAAIHIESDQFKFGSTSLFSQNESRATVADSNDWDLSDTNGSPFTIEYWYWQNSTGGAFIPVNWLDTGFGSGVLIMHNATTMHVRFFTDAIGDVQWNTASFGFSSNTWMHICIEKNSSGKMRVYLDGVMKGTNTPANSTIRHGTSQLFINQAAAGGTSYIDELRITKGVARYDSDSGFSVPTAAFPRS